MLGLGDLRCERVAGLAARRSRVERHRHGDQRGRARARDARPRSEPEPDRRERQRPHRPEHGRACSRPAATNTTARPRLPRRRLSARQRTAGPEAAQIADPPGEQRVTDSEQEERRAPPRFPTAWWSPRAGMRSARHRGASGRPAADDAEQRDEEQAEPPPSRSRDRTSATRERSEPERAVPAIKHLDEPALGNPREQHGAGPRRAVSRCDSHDAPYAKRERRVIALRVSYPSAMRTTPSARPAYRGATSRLAPGGDDRAPSDFYRENEGC